MLLSLARGLEGRDVTLHYSRALPQRRRWLVKTHVACAVFYHAPCPSRSRQIYMWCIPSGITNPSLIRAAPLPRNLRVRGTSAPKA